MTRICTRLSFRSRRMKLRLTVCLLTVVFSANAAMAQSPADYFPEEEWRTSKVNRQGFNKKVIRSLLNRIRAGEIRDLHSLLIVRNGFLVVEEYFNNWRADDLHTLQSDSKSITSLLIGIAIQQRKIATVEDRAMDFFPDYQPIRNLDAHKAALTVQDLLTMRTGMAWSEGSYQGSPLQQMNECACNWLRFVVDWPMREPPGTRFEYNSGGVIMLGGILQNATGMRVEEFARQHLFAPLSITRFDWFPGLGNFVVHTGGGLNLRSLDMAKIGYLVLRKGRWQEQQIIAPEWIEESMRHWVRYPRTFAGRPVDYGYLWWLLPLDGTGEAQGEEADIYTASGARDQWIFIIPKYDIVVVVTGNTSSTFAQPVEFLYNDILRAIQ